MNRILSHNRITRPEAPADNPYYRPTKQLRADAETALREMAYVLHLTRRVKESILDDRQERELCEPTVV
jgi:hypothetical protein